MGDREHGGTHRQSPDLLQSQLDQTVALTHICSHCGKRLRSHWDLQIHARIHTIEKLYRCPECEQSFYTKGKLVRHQEATHNLQFPLLFPEAEVQRVSEQESHPVKGTEQNYLSAPSTGKSREISSQAEAAPSSHHACATAASSCLPALPQEALPASSLCSQPAHPSWPRRAVCIENEKVHGHQHKQETVIKLNPMRKDALLPNQDLSESISQGTEASGSQLEREAVTKSHLCVDCGKSFKFKSYLIRHQGVHTGEKPHQCPDCGKGFLSKWYLDQHRRVHTGEKPYTCLECGKCFAFSSGLHQHERSHR